MSLWSSAESQLFLNPKLAQSVKDSFLLQTQKANLKNHIWLMSSGTESLRQGEYKLVALAQEAILLAAKSVTTHFAINSKDCILSVLPSFHIGGLSQSARAFVSGARFVQGPDLQWHPEEFVKQIEEKNVTVTSLVPTQVYDLAREQRTAPSSLRLCFVGAGALGEDVYQQALILGWPLIKTYGMTETCAMLAYQMRNEKAMNRFNHIKQWESREEERLCFKSAALLSGYLFVDSQGGSRWQDPKVDGWYLSDDRGHIDDDKLTLLGRESELVKIKGETVSLAEQNARWQQLVANSWQNDSFVVALQEERDGFELVLVAESFIDLKWVQKFNEKRLPFERLSKIYQVRELPITELGKLRRAELLEMLKGLNPLVVSDTL